MIAIAIDAKARINISAARSRNCLRLRCRLVLSEVGSNSDRTWLLRKKLLAFQRVEALLSHDLLALGSDNPVHQCLRRSIEGTRGVPEQLSADRIRIT